MAIEKKSAGRPPAPWMYELANLKIEDNEERIDYKQLSEKFDISIRAAQAFCGKLSLQATYRLENRFAVRLFYLRDLKKAAGDYISGRM